MTVVSPYITDTTLIQDGQSAGSITAADIREMNDSLSAIPYSGNSPQTASYTATIQDRGSCIDFNSATPVLYTIPPNSSVAYDVGTLLVACQIGVGMVTFTAGAGVTLNGSKAKCFNSAQQNSMIFARKTATNTWNIYGDLMGQFYVSGGQIYSPGGVPFIARGINLYDWAAPQPITSAGTNNGLAILQYFPQINIVRVDCNAYASWSGTFVGGNDGPSNFTTFVANMTSAGIVVVFCGFLYSNLGLTVLPPTGSNLTNEETWIVAMYAAYANNPFVWFETDNELAGAPGDTAPGNGATITAEHVGIYNALRGAGYRGPILICPTAGLAPTWTGTSYGGTSFYNNDNMTAASYNTMWGIVWDLHYYGFISSYNTAYSVVLASVQNQIVQMQAFTTSADGLIPVIFGEYGNSTSAISPDINGTQVVMAVQYSGAGSMAWEWSSSQTSDILANWNGSTITGLTVYGAEVATFIAFGPTSSSGMPYIDQGLNINTLITGGIIFNHAPIQTFTALLHDLQLTVRDATTTTCYAATFVYMIQRESGTPTITTSAVDLQLGTAGYIAFGGGTIQLSWTSIAADGSTYTLQVNNTSAHTITVWAGPQIIGLIGQSITGTLLP